MAGKSMGERVAATMPNRTVAEVRDALLRIQRAIDAHQRPFDHPVEIMAVTKGFHPEIVRLAVEAGCTAIGENYAQELLTRRPILDELAIARPSSRPTVSFIGHLQSNKVRQLVGLVDVWATVDRYSLAEEIAKRDPGGRVMIQLNATGEPQKFGCTPEVFGDLVACCRADGLTVEGVLAMGPTTGGPQAAAPGFALTRRLMEDHGLAVCSIGMTADISVAIAAGSTQVRIGTNLFGSRPPQKKWSDR